MNVLAGFTVALGVIVWMYTVVAIHNGGGFMLALAIIATFIIVLAGLFYAIWIGNILVAWALISAIIVGFVIVIFARDDGLLN